MENRKPVTDTVSVTWIDHRREPKCPPNPDYPDGIDLDMALGQTPFCDVDLPYPARRCGIYDVECKLCIFRTIITTAGRPDDPRSVRIPCQLTRRVQ